MLLDKTWISPAQLFLQVKATYAHLECVISAVSVSTALKVGVVVLGHWIFLYNEIQSGSLFRITCKVEVWKMD